MKKTNTLNYLYIIIAATLWGSISFFLKTLSNAGMPQMDIVAIRFTLSAIILSIYTFFKDKSYFKIRIKDIWCFIGTGIISLFFFTCCYFSAITMTTASIAAVLLYTAPVFVMIFSIFLFKEELNKNKIIALIMTFIGCILVTGIIFDRGNLSSAGIILGILSGFGYALYSIFGRYAINRGYSSVTISMYTFLFAAPPALICSDITKSIQLFTEPAAIWGAFGMSVLCCVLPYVLYTLGLKGVESSKASILATVEPAVATVISICFYHEQISFFNICGILLIFASIFVLNMKNK